MIYDNYYLLYSTNLLHLSFFVSPLFISKNILSSQIISNTYL